MMLKLSSNMSNKRVKYDAKKRRAPYPRRYIAKNKNNIVAL